MSPQQVRLRILHALYEKRRARKYRAFLTKGDVYALIGEDPEFDLDYMAEKGWITLDGHHCRITALGIDQVEAEQ